MHCLQMSNALHVKLLHVLPSQLSKRQGFAQHLKLLCKIFDQSFSEGYTSPISATNNASSAKPFTVNDMLVFFFSQIGVGYSGMQALGTILGTEIMHMTTYKQKNTKYFSRSLSKYSRSFAEKM